MGLTLTTALRNAILQAITDAINAGSGAAYIEIWTSGFGTKLSTHTCSDPFEDNITNGVLTADPIGDDSSADASGTAAAFKIFTSAAVEVFRGTVGTSGADINFAGGNVFTAGQIVRILSFTLTQPAS